jgi:isoleucyl-tRNA synthetase
MPFLTEAVYQNLVRAVDTHAPASIHMASWPEQQHQRLDRTLLADMEVVQRMVALGRAARNDSSLKVRQPLARILVRVPEEGAPHAVQRHAPQIREELNVKQVQILPRDANLVTYRIKPNLPLVGKRYGKLLPAIREALSRTDGADIAAKVAHGEAVTSEVSGQPLALEPAEPLVETSSAAGFACAEGAGYLVGLETTLTEELRLEGLARELVRTVQEARKEAGLAVSDRIVLDVQGSTAIATALSTHRPYIETETLTSRWDPLEDSQALTRVAHKLGEASWVIRLRRDN